MSTVVQTRVDELREQLAEVLAQDKIDYGKIVALSSELAKLDPENVRFSTDAAIISRLGRELVAKQETAVSELIKNAYDADATHVDLIFDNTDEPGGTLEILDNGHGMTREQLINGFMRISSIDKVENPISPKYNRSRAGKKGIGRFAAQRLGKKLEIITQTEEADTALRVQIDWSEFEGGRDLATIANRIEEVPEQDNSGTTLIIRELREAWSETSIRRIYRYTSDVLQPFPLAKASKKDDIDPGFHIGISRKVDDDNEIIADEKTEIFDRALARITGTVDEEGNGFWSVYSERYALSEENIPLGDEGSGDSFEALRGVKFEAYYFIYRRDLIPHGYLTLLKELADEKGGIRVYRNGFRVLPYGEPSDDWLRLDELYRRRTFLPSLGNKHVFGFVEIEDPDGEIYEETSSREGLIENRAFRELRSFVHRALVAAVTKISEARGIKQRTNQKDWDGRSNADWFRSITDRLEKAASMASEQKERIGDESEEEFRKEAADNAEELTDAIEELRTAADIVLEENGMLRILASLGLSIGVFTHEIKTSIGSLAGDANFLAHELDDGSVERQRASRLKKNVDNFKSYSAYFDQAVARNVSRELEIQDLGRIAINFVSTVKSTSEKYGILLEDPEILGYDLYTCPMHPSEWPSILFNFFTNAKKAIDEADVHPGKMLIRVGRVGDKVYLEFQDNGVGIPPENEERIFDAFFTTFPPAGFEASDDEVLRGSGLGLKIVDDIISSYRGEVFVSNADSEYNTCLRVELPAASNEEIPLS